VSGTPATATTSNAALAGLAAEFPWPSRRPVHTGFPEQTQGWLREGTRDALASALSEHTRVIVELGVWLGLSTRFMLERAPKATVISIDTWAGSPEHFDDDEWREMLPTLYEAFLSLNWEHRERIVPLRRSTVEGLAVVAAHGVEPDVIYVDACHEYEAVLEDLETSYRLFPRAEIVGDDYDWLGVRQAIDVFSARHGFVIVRFRTGWRMKKEGSSAG
jgi:hypothetical protein